MTDQKSFVTVLIESGPEIAAFDVGRYFVAATAMFLIVLWVRATRWRARKIQSREPQAADYRRELLASIRTGLLFAASGVLIAWGMGHGIFKLELGELHPLRDAAVLAAILVAHDTYFYWTHRAMHHPRLFRAFHRTHHRSTTPTPFAAYSFDVPEALVQAAFVPLWLLLIPTHTIVLFAFLTIMIVRNVWGHCGYELHPRGLADHPIGGALTTTVHHDLHHSGGFNTNFGLYFTWWDRVMGTEHPSYRDRFRCVTGAKSV